MDEIIKFENLARTLNEYGIAVRNAYQDRIIKGERIASGRLLNSVEYLTEFNGNIYEVYLSLEDYWKYLETGTEPHFPPVDKILEWVKIKPVLPRPYYKRWTWVTKDGKRHENGKMVLPTPKEQAWMIARKIEREGTEGSHDLEQVLEEMNARFETLIMDAINGDLFFAIDAEIRLLVRPYAD